VFNVPGVAAAGADNPHWFAGCGMLVAGGLCRRMLVDDGESWVAGKVHRLLRVPPTGSSRSDIECINGRL